MEITVRQMYEIEDRGHGMGFLKKFMMENAGAAAVRRLVEEFGQVASKEVLVLAGMGNNGGDGLVMARHLAGHGAAVTVVLLGRADSIKTEESRWNWSILEQMPSVTMLQMPDVFAAPDRVPDIIVDGILGTGIAGRIRDPYASAIAYMGGVGGRSFRLAVDVPSGLDPQTGTAAEVTAECDMTVTFHRMKQGIPKRPDLTGTVYVERIGIPPEAEEGVL